MTTGGPGCREAAETVQAVTEAIPALALYPNPSQGSFTVEVPGAWTGGELRLEVYNTLGQAVYTHVSTTSEQGVPETIGVSLPQTAAAGTYLVRVTAGGNTYSDRLVVQH